jgi:hypothetical protein
MSSSEQMQMQVVDRLPAILQRVDDDTISAIQSCAARNLRSLHQKMPEKLRVILLRVGERLDVLLWHEQKVGGCLRVEVLDAKA